jgi:hypothetical protein
MKIKVVDDICGSGKTSWAIQRINSPNFGEKFIYVTPYLDEVDRIINSTKAEFIEPEVRRGKGSKMKHFKELLVSNHSIVTTHQLFRKMDNEALKLIKNAGYTLIMDEVASVLETVKIAPKDIDILIEAGTIEVKEDGSVKWNDEKYGSEENSRFPDIKALADSNNLFIYGNAAMFWTMNVNNFLSFKDVYILTYLFDGQTQKRYYDIHGVEYDKYSVNKIGDNYEIVPYNKFKEPRREVYDKLNIYIDYAKGKSVSKLNSNYYDESLTKKQRYGVLSSTWFNKYATNEQIEQLNNNLRNYFANQLKTSNKEIFWSTIKSFATELKNKKCTFNKKDDRSKDNFVSLFTRATNSYADRTAMAYVYNRFMNPMEKRFFLSKGAKVDENTLAMSDLIQFMFRGCIRKGEPMNCYIPSERMRNLLKDWSEFRD